MRRLAFLLALTLSLPASAAPKKKAAEKERSSKYISRPEAPRKRPYRFGPDGEAVVDAPKAEAEKKGKKAKKEKPKKENKYVSASPEAGQSVYRFDEGGNPVVRRKDKKKEKPKDEGDGEEADEPKPKKKVPKKKLEKKKSFGEEESSAEDDPGAAAAAAAAASGKLPDLSDIPGSGSE